MIAPHRKRWSASPMMAENLGKANELRFRQHDERSNFSVKQKSIDNMESA